MNIWKVSLSHESESYPNGSDNDRQEIISFLSNTSGGEVANIGGKKVAFIHLWGECQKPIRFLPFFQCYYNAIFWKCSNREIKSFLEQILLFDV